MFTGDKPTVTFDDVAGVEEAKQELSSRKETTINLPYITANQSGPKHLDEKLTRAKFESMIDGMLSRTMDIL